MEARQDLGLFEEVVANGARQRLGELLQRFPNRTRSLSHLLIVFLFQGPHFTTYVTRSLGQGQLVTKTDSLTLIAHAQQTSPTHYRIPLYLAYRMCGGKIIFFLP